MKVTGIVCEYNPFHNGHKYHIEETKHRLDSEYIIGIMSGDFTQRGRPAIVDKYSRTHMALMGGCDVVIELPVRYATSSAEGFASAAVSTLAATGVCDSISFGSEQGNLDTLTTIADILYNEPEEFSKLLTSYIKQGQLYPKARELALIEYTGNNLDIAYEPNNILAIEYLKACTGTGITPYTIKRTDNGYHSTSLDNTTESSGLLSAEAIRNIIFGQSDISFISDFIPKYTENMLHDPVSPDMFADLIYYSLLSNADKLEQYVDISHDLADRIRKNLCNYTGLEEFISLVKSKNVTFTRIERALIHCLLGISKLTDNPVKYPVAYIRILGFRRNSSKIMKAIQKNASVPVITKPAHTNSLDTLGSQFLNEDIRASELYNHVRYLGTANAAGKLRKNEYTHGIIIL